jgi:hypothetical protein
MKGSSDRHTDAAASRHLRSSQRVSWPGGCTLRRGLTVLVSAASLTACAVPPTPTPQATPNPECLSGSATEYTREAGLDLDVRIYDENRNKHERDHAGERCFTTHEKAWIDELKALSEEGAEGETLQKIIDDHPTVGPGTVQALRLDWDATLFDQQFDPTIEFYSRERLGWVPIDIATGISLPGLRLREAGVEGTSRFPIDEKLRGFVGPDWNPDPGDENRSSFLDEAGRTCALNLRGQGYPEYPIPSSLDITYSASMRGTPLALGNITLDHARVERITVVDEFDPIIGWLNDAYLLVEYDVHPDDTPMLGFESYSAFQIHLTPNPSSVTFTKEDYERATGLTEGSTINTGDFIGYQNPRMDGGYGPNYDLSIWVRERIPGLVGPAYNGSLGHQVLGILGHMEYPREVSATPTQPRYSDEDYSIHGCDPE